MKTLKEQILEILNKYKNIEYWYFFGKESEHEALINLASPENIADEILTLFKDYYPKEFIEWLEFGNHPFVKWYDLVNGEIVNFFTDEISPTKYSLDELFEYWQTNINKK